VHRKGLTIDFPPVSNTNDKNADQLVLNAGNDSVVADAILPELTEFRALQRLADTARVVERSDTFKKKAGESAGNLRIELFQLALSPRA